MSTPKCRFCKKNSANSKEHLIANKRIKRTNLNKNDNEKNDNSQKKFRKITCNECNAKLGIWEELNAHTLAYATIWKLLAGNTNNAFERQKNYILNISSNRTIEHYEGVFLSCIKNNSRIPPYEYSFSFNQNNSKILNNPGFSSTALTIKTLDENDNILEGVRVFTSDDYAKGEINQSFSDKNGEAVLNIFHTFEAIRIIQETYTLPISSEFNIDHPRKIHIDYIFYISLDRNHNRLLIIIPLFMPLISKLDKEVKILIPEKKGFLRPLKIAFPELDITSIDSI